MAAAPEWVSASELAEYAYCPRAWHYARRWPDAPATGPQTEGAAYHRRVLTAERRRAAHAPAYWAGILVGAVGIVLGLLAAVRP